jgi:integrase
VEGRSPKEIEISSEEEMKDRQEKKHRGVYEKLAGSGTFWIRFADGFGRIRRQKVGSKSAAISLYHKRKNEALEQKHLPENLRTVVRVSNLVQALEEDYERTDKKSRNSVKVRVHKHILPFFGTMAADAVSTSDLHRYVDRRRQEGASNASINREMAALRRAFNIGRASTPPKVRAVPVFPHLTENPPRQGFVEDQKYTRLAAHANELWLKAILATAYTFGFRKSELLLNMKVRQVDLENRTLRLFAGTTKNNEGRIVKMTAEVYGLLRDCVWNKEPEDPVFTRANNEPVKDFRGSWYALCEAAGLGKFVKDEDGKQKWQGLLFHDLRRSAVRNMVRRGISETVAMRLSGHRTRAIFARYDICSLGDIEDATAKIEGGSKIPENRENRTDTTTSTRGSDEARPQVA